ncbi:MAG: ATP-binding cassette domain-containing protein [Opitutales bacterium]|nr:ATP-binding cassette domain-containing protein [Opitutales bacterium]
MHDVLTVEGATLTKGTQSILKDIHFQVQTGEVHAIIGPNGSGKSSLLKSIAGHPSYALTSGTFYLNQQPINEWAPDKRAQNGIFLAFQSPNAIEGVTVANFLRTALRFHNPEQTVNATRFYQNLYALLEQVGLPKDFTSRSVHCNFSGGEQKRLELLQLLLFKPKFALLDELDSGLDLQAREIVLQTVRTLHPHTGFIIVSHAMDFLHQLPLTHLYLLQKGSLVTKNPSDLDAVASLIKGL